MLKFLGQRVQKSVNLVDLVKSFHTSMYLQTSASVQQSTGLLKFGGDFIHLSIRPLSSAAAAAARVVRREAVHDERRPGHVGEEVRARRGVRADAGLRDAHLRTPVNNFE